MLSLLWLRASADPFLGPLLPSMKERGEPHHDGYPQDQHMGAQKLPEELPVKVGLHNTGCGAGGRGLFCLT